MKRLFVLILAIALVFSSSAFSEAKDPSFFYGTWLSISTQPAGRYMIVAIHLSEGGAAYFTRQIFKDGEQYENVQEIRSWVPTADGVSITAGDGGITDLTLFDDGMLGNQKGRLRYGYTRFEKQAENDVEHRIAGMDNDSLLELFTLAQNELFSRHAGLAGVLITPGEYSVGDDLPAAKYRIDAPAGSSEALIEVKRADTDFYDAVDLWFLGESYDATSVVINLHDGDVLLIYESNVVLKVYSGLF